MTQTPKPEELAPSDTPLSERLRAMKNRAIPKCDDVCIAEWELNELIAQAETMEESPIGSVIDRIRKRITPETKEKVRAAFARHLSSQAPGNLSEKEVDAIVKSFPAGQWNDHEQYIRGVGIAMGLRYARDHYLSGWVACSERLPELPIVASDG